MPRVTFAPGFASSPRFIESVVDQLAFASTITGATPTLVTAQSGAFVFTAPGVGYTYGLVAGQTGLTGGLINGLVVRQSGALQMTITNIGLSAVSFQNAIVQENAGTNIAALEDLLLGLNWNYVGNGNADVLLSTDRSGDGVLLNLRGDDTFFGGGGNDNIFLGDGDDLAQGDAGNDQFFGGLGNDEISGDTRADVGNDRLYGGLGNDTLNGGAGDDTVRGGAGNDELRDEGGSDEFDGGSGVDTLVLDSRGLTTTVFNVTVNLTTGMQGSPDIVGDEDLLVSIENYTHAGVFNMTLIGSAGRNQLLTDAGIDQVAGLDGNDFISTGALADRLDGGTGSDTLDGGSSADRLTGGAGNDEMTGGAGRDTFVFGMGSGVDTITDFQVLQDRIDILPTMSVAPVQTADGLQLIFGPGQSVLLEGVNIVVFSQIDFI